MNDNNDQSREEEKRGGTLDLKNISINTLKDDLAKSGGEEKKDSAGWFSFLAKHKTANDTPAQKITSDEGNTVPPGLDRPAQADAQAQNPLASALSDSKVEMEPKKDFLGEELEEFKAENEIISTPIQNQSNIQETEKEKTPSETVEAPPNLPIAEDTAQVNPVDAEEPSNLTVANETEVSSERPSLGSFFPREELQNTLLSGNGNEDKQMAKIEPAYSGKGIVGNIVGDEGYLDKTETENKNPFSSRIVNEKKGKDSLLHDVESALNYSAPPDFSEKRESLENELAKGEEETKDQTVDLQKKLKPGGLLKNKKMVLIFGGIGGLVLIAALSLIFLGGKSSDSSKDQTSSLSQENKNQNTNSSPIKPVAPVISTSQTKPVLNSQKVLPNVKEINVGSLSAIATEVEKIRKGQTIRQQTQLIFLKPDGSSISFQELMDSLEINISKKILLQPESAAALYFADFFQGQTIFGIIIPTKDKVSSVNLEMKNWEPTMVDDLNQLWQGITIDNRGAYFSDSQVFSGGRFALIDKKSKLSLDYMVKNDYIFIACGKDSMTILEKQFTGNSSSDASNSGIKWEGETTSTVSGVNIQGSAEGNTGNSSSISTSNSSSGQNSASSGNANVDNGTNNNTEDGSNQYP